MKYGATARTPDLGRSSDVAMGPSSASNEEGARGSERDGATAFEASRIGGIRSATTFVRSGAASEG